MWCPKKPGPAHKVDIVVGNMWGPSTYYHNECRQCGNFLGLHLRLPVAGNQVATTIILPGHPDKQLLTRPAIGVVGLDGS
jgi:enediyne biosynthesis protein E4